MKQESRPNSKKFPDDEKQRQKFRKTLSPSSRFLDNYYNSDIYGKSWWPNGLYILKKKYTYSESGLCFNYERNNTLQKRLVTGQIEKKTQVKHFLEFDYLEEREFLVTIEYCANCREHQTHTSHSSELFHNLAVTLQKCITLRFPFIKVLLKPIDTDIIIETNLANHILNKTKVIDDKYKEVRIGAFEVQIGFLKSKGNPQVEVIFSKLQTGTWPSLSSILNKIVAFMPLVSCEISIYDQESDHYEENKDPLLDTKLERIKLNLYKQNNTIIYNLLTSSNEELQNYLDPKKRLLSSKKKERESINIQNNIGATKSNFFSSQGHISSPSNSSNISIANKGELLITLYSDRDGKIIIRDIPYDSYFLEIEESSNYMSSFLLLNFKQIESQRKIQKFIGLKSQVNSFLQVFVYHTVDQVIDSAEVVLHSNLMTSEEKLLFEEQETKIKLKECRNVKGRYEGILVPGKYTITVFKNNFDIARKQIQLVQGENKVNIELVREQSYKLKVTVLNYENFSAVENALIKLSFGNDHDILEGVSSSEGNYIFSANMNEDFVSVFVEKPGYLPGQRTYIRDVAGNSGEEMVTKNIIVALVKENYILKDNSVVMVTYCNLLEENFEPVFLYSKNIGNFTDISCNDCQMENGIITSYFKYHTPKKEETSLMSQNEDLDEIIRIMFRIKSKRLKKDFKFSHSMTLNGLQRFSCETVIYTSHNVFYIKAPSFSREKNYELWDLGFLDIKNLLFYEISLLTETEFEKNLFFFDFTNLLQFIIDKKIFSKLFEQFEFEKGQFLNNDRFIYEPTFLRALRKLTGDIFSADFLLYICDMMKAHNKMISYSIFKKKITSNLKNFREIMKIY